MMPRRPAGQRPACRKPAYVNAGREYRMGVSLTDMIFVKDPRGCQRCKLSCGQRGTNGRRFQKQPGGREFKRHTGRRIIA